MMTTMVFEMLVVVRTTLLPMSMMVMFKLIKAVNLASNCGVTLLVEFGILVASDFWALNAL